MLHRVQYEVVDASGIYSISRSLNRCSTPHTHQDRSTRVQSFERCNASCGSSDQLLICLSSKNNDANGSNHYFYDFGLLKSISSRVGRYYLYPSVPLAGDDDRTAPEKLFSDDIFSVN